MIRQELIRSMERYTGAGTITCTQLTHYLGKENNTRIRNKYLLDIKPCDGKSYFIPEVADQILVAQ